MTAAFAVMMTTERWHHRFSFLVIGQLMIVAGALLTSVAQQIILFVFSMLILGFGSGITYYSSIFYSLEGHSGRAQKSGIHESVLGWGIFLGPLIGGYVADATGRTQNQYLTGVVVLAVMIVVEWRLFLRLVRAPWKGEALSESSR